MQTQRANAALSTLMILQGIMLTSLYAGVAPHPPAAVAPFAMGPFLAASLSAAFAAILLGAAREGRTLSAIAAFMALVSFGPQKVIDPAFSQIWPAVVTAWIAIAVIAHNMIKARGGTTQTETA